MRPRTTRIRRSSSMRTSRSRARARWKASTCGSSPRSSCFRCAATRSSVGTATAERPIVGVLALQGDVAEHLAALERAGATALEVKTPADLARADALIIPGGESTTVAKLLERFGLAAPIKER